MSRPKLNVLISDTRLTRNVGVFPIVFGSLKAYADRDPRLRRGFEWLTPILERDEPEAILDRYQGRTVDVFGISCYQWNWEHQRELARAVRRRFPDCLIVAGGPHCRFDADFFERTPEIDIGVIKDGEIPFSGVLLRRLEGRRDFADIAGLALSPEKRGADPVLTPPQELVRDLEASPFDAFDGAYPVETLGGHDTERVAFWETTRGCPYGCTFCDWGSNTHSKIRAFPMERIRREIAFFAENRIKHLYIFDANFGILKRDLEVTEALIESKRRTGYPVSVQYCATKNQPEKIVAIASRLAAADMSHQYVLSLQHTHDEVLDAVRRSNLSPSQTKDLIDTFRKEGLPVATEMIVGCPGDTPERFRRAIADLHEWGMSEEIIFHLFSILPNSPAAAPEYRERWGLDSVRRAVPARMRGKGKRLPSWEFSAAEIAVGSKSYDREDWVSCMVYADFITLFQVYGLTRYAAAYLRKTHGVPFLDFYTRLIDQDIDAGRSPHLASLKARIEAHWRRYAEESDAVEEMEIEGLPDYPDLVEPCNWLLARCGLDPQPVHQEIAELLRARYSQFPKLEDLLGYQAGVFLDAGFDPEKGRFLEARWDWASYFETLWAGDCPETLSEPEPLPEGVCLEACDKEAGWYFSRPLGSGDLSRGRRNLEWAKSVLASQYFRSGRAWLRRIQRRPRALAGA